MQHADMSEREIEAAVQRFRGPSKKDPTKGDEDPAGGLERGGAVIRGRTFIDPGVLGGQDGEDGAVGAEPVPRQKVLLTTDAPLRALSKDAIPLAPTLLINYDIPARKVRIIEKAWSTAGHFCLTPCGPSPCEGAWT